MVSFECSVHVTADKQLIHTLNPGNVNHQELKKSLTLGGGPILTRPDLACKLHPTLDFVFCRREPEEKRFQSAAKRGREEGEGTVGKQSEA